MKIKTCLPDLPAQTWEYLPSNNIKFGGNGEQAALHHRRLELTTSVSPFPDLCLDLSKGDPSNGNPIQMFKCSPGNKNQIWKTSPASFQALAMETFRVQEAQSRFCS